MKNRYHRLPIHTQNIMECNERVMVFQTNSRETWDAFLQDLAEVKE